MTTRPRLRRLGPPAIRRLDLAAPNQPSCRGKAGALGVARLPSTMEAGNGERAKLYASPRWRRERREFLRQHPMCSSPGCGQRAQVADHARGHQDADWRRRFWDQETWQPMCAACHGVKSRAELTAWRQAGG